MSTVTLTLDEYMNLLHAMKVGLYNTKENDTDFATEKFQAAYNMLQAKEIDHPYNYMTNEEKRRSYINYCIDECAKFGAD